MSFSINNNLIIKILSLISIVSLTILLGCGGGGSSTSNSGSGNTDGKGGSLSRFSLIGDFLYTISGKNIQLYSLLTNPAVPEKQALVPVGRGIETLYSYGNNLFIGAETGVYIYNNTNPSKPTQLSKFLHVRSCDPVVVSGSYAYVTLRGGGRCGFGASRMEVLNIKDPSNPQFVKSYPMQNPKGLGIQDGLLFICDDIAGLKVFELTIPKNPVRLVDYTNTNINCYDLIPHKKNIVSNAVIAGDLVISDNTGILQYRYDTTGLTKDSEILINSPAVAQ